MEGVAKYVYVLLLVMVFTGKNRCAPITTPLTHHVLDPVRL